jgi:hypothetical protein
VSEEG